MKKYFILFILIISCMLFFDLCFSNHSISIEDIKKENGAGTIVEPSGEEKNLYWVETKIVYENYSMLDLKGRMSYCFDNEGDLLYWEFCVSNANTLFNSLDDVNPYILKNKKTLKIHSNIYTIAHSDDSITCSFPMMFGAETFGLQSRSRYIIAYYNVSNKEFKIINTRFNLLPL